MPDFQLFFAGIFVLIQKRKNTSFYIMKDQCHTFDPLAKILTFGKKKYFLYHKSLKLNLFSDFRILKLKNSKS